MGKVTGNFVDLAGSEPSYRPTAPHFRLHTFDKAPRHDNAARKFWADRGHRHGSVSAASLCGIGRERAPAQRVSFSR
jgi:hypothetical protein